MKKVLIPGGTGAMGVYLVPELLKLGYKVDVISLDDKISDNSNLKYIKANAKDYDFVSEILKNDYDAVVDFMIYSTKEEYQKFLPLYLKNVGHYIFLSTYRVYANEEHPIKETSPRLLDASKDKALLSAAERYGSGDYCIYKAESENFLRASVFSNWTVIRPAVTYSQRRFQLVTLEMPIVIRRMLEGKTVVLPEPAMKVQATMSWAGDVAKMISRLVLNKAAYRETYSVCTSEHNSWEDVAKMYGRIGRLKYCTTDTDTFLNVWAPDSEFAKWQLIYDRYFDRIMDNSKILNIAGMKQSELMPLEKGLAMEFDRFPRDYVWDTTDWAAQMYNRMDEYLSKTKL